VFFLEDDLVALPINTIPFQFQQLLSSASRLDSKIDQVHEMGGFLINCKDQLGRLFTSQENCLSTWFWQPLPNAGIRKSPVPLRIRVVNRD
jgi:hypothetical protein